MHTLCELVQTDILDFLAKNEELLFNERDLQMHLAIWLRASKNAYDDVDLEYYVPLHELRGYVCKSEMRLDIVVKKNGEFLPVELKYKTKRLERSLPRFGEVLSSKIPVMKNQSAQNLGMYNYWKDVRRLELVCQRFASVKNGLAVFVTNDPLYTQKTRSTSTSYPFDMSEGVHSKIKHWGGAGSSCAKDYPDFEVEKDYAIHWNQKTIDGEPFYYSIILV